MASPPPPSLRAGFRTIAPLTPAVLAFGISYGVLARASGMGWAAPIVMSATTFGGSAQFAVASIFEYGGTAAAAIVAAILLNARYLPMSISVGPYFEGPAWRRLVTSQLIVDESWALSVRGGGRFDPGVLLGAGLVLFPCWVGGTAIGVFAGDFVGDPERLGMDAAFPALFLALLVPMVRSRRAALAAVGGAGLAFALIPFSEPGVPIVAASLACLIGLRR